MSTSAKTSFATLKNLELVSWSSIISSFFLCRQSMEKKISPRMGRAEHWRVDLKCNARAEISESKRERERSYATPMTLS